jgi:hypothetical protein
VAPTTPTSSETRPRSERTDPWWVGPTLTAAALTGFGVYSVFAAAQGSHYLATRGGAHYLSPFYSPDLHSMLGLSLPFSYAFLVLWAPLGLRASCYYYRKSYYRAFFWSPPACAVTGPSRRPYRGETRFPFVLQNAHRYLFYCAAIVIGFLWYDAVRAFFFRAADGSLEIGVGIGSLVLLANVVALSAFTFGCNSFRHLAGGNLDCFSCSRSTRARHGLWRRVTRLNVRHGQWAWISLVTVGLADLYIRLDASGVFHDPRLF